MKEKELENNRKWPFIISLLIHFGLVATVLFLERERPNIASKEMEIEWVEIQDADLAALKKMQVVEQEDRLNKLKPKDNYKLSKFDQKVKEETRAAKTGAFKNSTEKKEGKKQKQQQASAQEQAPPSPDQLSLSDLKPSLFKPTFDPSKIQKQADSGGKVSKSDDYLKNVKLGAQTLLSTREFVYYSYYNRIKKKLRQHWEPRIKKKIVRILKKGRTIASARDKITRLVITLDKSGQLVRVTLKGASGYNDLDDAAIEAFKAAAPFPNPPSGIVDPKGEIKINWDFVLET